MQLIDQYKEKLAILKERKDLSPSQIIYEIRDRVDFLNIYNINDQ